jgi:hypothetical protein
VFLTSPLHLNTFAKRKKKPLPNFPTPPFTLNFFTYNQMLNSLLALMPNPKKSPTMLLKDKVLHGDFFPLLYHYFFGCLKD